MTDPVKLHREGRVSVVTIDHPPVNALSHSVRAGLVAALDQAAADPESAAIVIACAGRSFVAGADVREFGTDRLAAPPRLKEVMARLEDSKKPVVAALFGTALGGGLELALACHYRVAAPGTRLGLPEVKLGIVPGAGGTQRLPRLVGVEAALRMVVDGNEMRVDEAEKIGLVDAIVDGDLSDGAIAFAEELLAQGRGPRPTGALAVQLDNPAIFDEWTKNVTRRQRGFPAPLKAIETVRLAATVPFTEGLDLERDISNALMAGPAARAQRHLFFAERETAKLPVIKDVAPRDIKTVAVIGPGVMGIGIAQCFANAGIPVRLLGHRQESLDRAMQSLSKSYASLVARGNLAQAEMDRRVGLVTPALRYEELAGIDLVVEAVSENIAVKQEVFAALDRHCKPGAILATNTSYLDIDALAKGTSRPQDVVGMHFLIPAHVMRLLENVRGEATAPDVLATVMALGKRLGKLPVLVGVCDGFVINRLLAKRSREGFFMLEEGATPWQIDKVLFEFGFPMGPYSLSDLAGLDVQWANRKARFDRLSPREQACTILDKIAGMGRYGQKTGAGYYKYDDKRVATPDPEIEALIVRHSAERGITRRTISDDEIRERCLYAMINEGAKILEEGVATRAGDIDVIAVNGFGFPAYRGGPMHYADEIGLKTVHAAILRYRDQVGADYFTPSGLLARLAAEGRGFNDA